MKSSIGDNARLNHILDAIADVQSYVKNLSFEEFESNSMVFNACLNQLTTIGEAANHLSEELKTIVSNIGWKEIIDLRNVLIHEYFGIDLKIVWDIVKTDLPILNKHIEESLKNLSK